MNHTLVMKTWYDTVAKERREAFLALQQALADLPPEAAEAIAARYIRLRYERYDKSSYER